MNKPGPRFNPVLPLAFLAVVGVASAVLASCAGGDEGPEPCNAGSARCGDACVNTDEDPSNCGACGVVCSGEQACREGRCEALGVGGSGQGGGRGAGGDGGGCADGQVSCAGECTDTQTDEAHCGGCDVRCRAEQTCVAGACACPDGQTDCADACVDLQSDPQHCGSCAVECTFSQACIAGACGCADGLTDCGGGVCADLQSSPVHCGACGTACDPGTFCHDGICSCLSGTYQDIGGAVPQAVTGNTTAGTGSYGLTCLAAGSTEEVLLFTAVDAGTYTFDTFGSSFDTALGVLRADSCAELACNDDSSGAQSKVAAILDPGDAVLVVVTGFNGAAGDFTVNVSRAEPPVCPSGALASTLPQTVTGDTATLGDAITPACGTLGSPDASYTFTAPAAGRYVFDTAGSSFNTILELHDTDCGGAIIDCNDDAVDQTSRIITDLSAGQTVVAVVDGFAGAGGPFTLNVTEYQPPPCPMIDLGGTTPQTVTGNNTGLENYLEPPCGPGGGREVTYSFTAPADGRYTFTSVSPSFGTVLYVQDGACLGPVLACSDGFSSSQASVPLSAGQTVVVVVDGWGDSFGTFTLDVTSIVAPPCPAIDLGTTVPQTLTGSTAALGDFVNAPCGSPGGAEATYRFTAPADGTYVFDTFGSSFNTVLHVHDGACGGPVLACNDNTTGVQSRVTAALTAGQTVVVVVDGSGPVSGNYTLHVSEFTAGGTCAAPIDLGSTVPQTVTGNTLLQPNSAAPSCAATNGNDLVYRFTAPAAGTYTIDTLGSVFDTVLHVHDGDCAGPEIACNDNASGSLSRVTVTLAAGQVITIVADSRASASGNLTMHIN